MGEGSCYCPPSVPAHPRGPWPSRPGLEILDVLFGPDQQYLAAAFQIGGWGCRHHGVGFAGVLEHIVDLGYRIIRREASTQSRAGQEVAFLDIGAVGQIGDLQMIRCPGADGDGAQAVAIDLYRDGVIGIGDQHGGAGEGVHVDNLAHDATGIQQRLAQIDLVAAALVDDDLACERFQVHRQQLADQHGFVDLFGGLQQFAQADVLHLEC